MPITNQVYSAIGEKDFTYSSFPPKDLNLTDRIVIFFAGDHWNIIQFDILLHHPLVHFTYYNQSTDEKYTNTLVTNPYTIQTMIIRDIVLIKSIDKQNYCTMHLTNTKTEEDFTLDRPFDINEGEFYKLFLRKPAIITTLRSLFTEGSGLMNDSKYIILNEEYQQSDYIINPKYFNDNLDYNDKQILTKYHPKTIVMMVQYYSEKKQKIKYTLLVNRDIQLDEPTGWNRIKSGVVDYLSRFKQQLNDKKAMIFPIFWYMADYHYPVKKIVYL